MTNYNNMQYTTTKPAHFEAACVPIIKNAFIWKKRKSKGKTAAPVLLKLFISS